MNAVEPKTVTQNLLKRFRPVPAEAFESFGSLGKRIYCLRENDPEPVLLCGERQTLTKDQLADIAANKIEALFISQQDFSCFSRRILEEIDRVVGDNSIAVEVRFALLQIAYADEVERLFCKRKITEYVELAQVLGKKISALIQSEDVSPQRLFDAVHHNSSFYTHVTNVASYAVVLAKELEMATPSELDKIAVGCLLHEVGKLYLPSELLNKKGRLSPRDHEEFTRVPLLAYETLSEFEDIECAQLMMAYQQNERLDGTGYPVRVMDEEIHPWAKLLAVVDAFDAITSERSFRSASGLRDGLIQLADSANSHFDPEIVLCWISAFQLQ